MKRVGQKILISILVTLLLSNVIVPCSFSVGFADGIDDIVTGLKEYENGLSFYELSSTGEAFHTLVFLLWSIVEQTTQEKVGVTITVEQMEKVVEAITILENLYARYETEVMDIEVMANMQKSIERKDAIQTYIDDGGIITVPEDPYNPDNSSDATSEGNLILGFLDYTFGILLYPIKLLLMVPGLISQGILSTIVSGGEESLVFGVSIDQILFNQLAITDINIFSNTTAAGQNMIGNKLIMEIRTLIANWYYAFRNFVIVVYLCILIYVGIRMAISSVAEDKAKYKNMLKNWGVGLALVMILHIIIIVIININSQLLMLIKPTNINTGEYTNLMSELFKQAFWFDFTTSFGSVILYSILTVLTFVFLIIYIKRMITISFLICVAPLITVTYPIDKAGDNKSQILNSWLKEFITDVLIQFFHCVIYVVLVQSSFNNMLSSGPLNFGAMFISIIMTCCIFYVEGVVKKLFGLDKGGATFLKTLAMGGILSKVGSNLKVIRGSKNDNQQNTPEVPNYMPSGENTVDVVKAAGMDKQFVKKIEHQASETANSQNESEGTKNNSGNTENVFKKLGKGYIGLIDKVAGVTVPSYNAIKNKRKTKYNMTLKDTQKLFNIACENYVKTKDQNMTKEEFASQMEELNQTEIGDIKDGAGVNMKLMMIALQRSYENKSTRYPPEERLKKSISSFEKKHFKEEKLS